MPLKEILLGGDIKRIAAFMIIEPKEPNRITGKEVTTLLWEVGARVRCAIRYVAAYHRLLKFLSLRDYVIG